MKFYHFSDKSIPENEYLDPEYFGKNNYTRNSRRTDNTPRLYFYDTPRPQECHTKGHRYRYTINISIKRLQHVSNFQSFTKTKSKGYRGVLSAKDLSPWQGCVLFRPIEFIEKTNLWRVKEND